MKEYSLAQLSPTPGFLWCPSLCLFCLKHYTADEERTSYDVKSKLCNDAVKVGPFASLLCLSSESQESAVWQAGRFHRQKNSLYWSDKRS